MALSLAAVVPTGFAAPSALAPSMRVQIKMQEAAAVVEEPPTLPPFNPKAFAESMAGVSGPLGFFDPLGYCNEATEGKIRFYREVEVKHCRVAMLAALGYPIAEQFHPLFATDDAPSFSAFQQTPLQTFWPAVVFAIAIPEIFSVFTFQNPASRDDKGQPAQPWTIRLDHEPGNLNFDPLGLKPSDPAEFLAMQNKELNNGRLAMIAIAGMVVQEGITGEKLF